jgi:23S rRNA U2552 (ribose-2'-O)-methylase RlmE/FtsJ
MAKYYNYDDYTTFIKDKFTKSKLYYKKNFNNEDPLELFLMILETMNVYPIYPRPITMPLKIKKYNIDLVASETLEYRNINMNKISEELNLKIKEFATYNKLFEKNRNTEKIRRFFDYEIKDSLRDILNNSKITIAWIKMYEILTTYGLLNHVKNNDTIKSFHICEHPGAFVFAVKEYVNNKSNKKHEFVFQSLRPGNDPQIFRADKELLNKYKTSLDYGEKNTGDITDADNIRYYRNKYKDQYYHIITSDCGLDFSEDFTKQETGLYKVYLGALICAIGLSKKGSNYVFKLFSFNDTKTVELLYIACMFYENVDLVRLMSEKSGSGEIYAICTNFNYNENIEPIFDKLLNYLQNNNGFIVDKFDNEFIDKIENYHSLLTMRRITNYNMLIYRAINHQYAGNNKDAIKFVKNLVDYYTKYFLIYIGFDEDGKIKKMID